jgi:glucan phosphoethanolaminetransferase (alkaline phosphatase superfamily)
LFGDVSFYEIAQNESNSVSVEYDSTEITENDETTSMNNTYLNYFIGCVGILALASLLFFKNRKLQAKLTAVNFLFILGLIVMMYYYSMNMNYFNEKFTGGLTFLSSIPLAFLVFNFLGLKGIRNDEKLIRSMDRLR